MKNTLIAIIGIAVVVVAVVLITNNNEQAEHALPLESITDTLTPNGQELEEETPSLPSESNTGTPLGSGDPETMTILIPELVLTGESYEIEYTETTVPYSIAVMNAAYQAFFDQYDNVYNGVSFDSVALDGNTALVYLTGSYIPVGTMTDLFVNSEINAVAFQFDTVNAIEVYLNGNLWDWCDYDNANPGEGFCSAGPRFWMDSKEV